MTKREIEIKTAEDNDSGNGGNGKADAKDAHKKADAAAAYAQQSGEEASAEPKEPEKEPEPPREPTPEERIAGLTDQLQRLAAEFDNYRKKNAREFERGLGVGSERVIERLLPVLDSMDMALQAPATDGSAQSILEGLKKVRQQLLESLLGAGMEIIDPAKGDPFNPHIHEVLMVAQTDEVESDHVFATFAKGYSYKGRLIRAAKVQVAKPTA